MRTLSLLAALAVAAAADDFKPEAGFTPLLADKDLTGWKAKTGGDVLAGQAEAYKGRFTLADGVLTIDPKVKGDVVIETDKTFAKDVHLKFEFKPGPKCNNDLYLRGMKFDLKVEDVKKWKEGEWNEFEIVVKGDQAEFKCNGETVKTLKASPGATPLGLRAELGPMQLRRLRVKEG